MRILSTSTLFVAFLAFFGISANAQNADPSRYDLGSVTLNKAFTQHITIKGEDLGKMPFTNLTDAIRAWLFGAFTQPTTLAYVVDGNPVSDPNIYPIFEIEEVTFIDHAAASAAYGNTQQELVLITTKRGAKASGIRAAAQAGLVKGDIDGQTTHTRVYHHYYLGAYKNLDKVSFGVSADWQRDVMPESNAPDMSAITPNNMERLRLNGYVTWRPDAQNTIEVRGSYAPTRVVENVDSAGADYAYQLVENLHQHLLIPSVCWQGNWLPGLQNKLFGEYLHSSVNSDFRNTDSSSFYSNTNGVTYMQLAEALTNRIDHLFLRDHLSYTASAGQWHIVPELDLSYQHITENMASGSALVSSDGVGTPNPGLLPLPNKDQTVKEKGSLFYITPSVDLTLAKALDLQAGLFVNASSKTDTGNRRFYPFFSAAIDLLHLQAASAGGSLKLFGSYARRPTLFIGDYGLNSYSGGAEGQTLFNLYHVSDGYQTLNGVTTTGFGFLGRPEPGYWTWVAGAAFATADGRFTLQYSYERRSFSYPGIDAQGYYTYELWKQNFHHADLRFKVIESKAVRWLTGLNVSLRRSRSDTADNTQNFIGYQNNVAGDVWPQKNSWSGGWVNRLHFGAFTAGLDVLYHFGVTAGVPPKNTMAVPNVYAGYRFGLPGARALDVFIESRGLVMNTPSDVIDQRRYYTLGASFGL